MESPGGLGLVPARLAQRLRDERPLVAQASRYSISVMPAGEASTDHRSVGTLPKGARIYLLDEAARKCYVETRLFEVFRRWGASEQSLRAPRHA